MMRFRSKLVAPIATMLVAGLLSACSEGTLSPTAPSFAKPVPVGQSFSIPSTQVVQLQLVSLSGQDFFPGGGGPSVGPMTVKGVGADAGLGSFVAYCIDWENQIAQGNIWNARILSFNDIVNNPLYKAVALKVLSTLPGQPWTGAVGPLRQAAYLAGQFDGSGVDSWDELQFNIWNLFGNTPPGFGPTNTPTTAADWLSQSATFAASGANTDGWKVIIDACAFDDSCQPAGQYHQTLLFNDPTTPTALGRITGGGVKAKGDNGEVVTFGLTLHCDLTLSNNLEINWKGHQWHLAKPITSATCTDDPNIAPPPPVSPFDTFQGEGYGRLDGVDNSRVTFKFQDAGEPGKNDTVELTVYEPGSNTVALHITAQKISVGNWQVHYDQPHGQKP